MKKLFKYVSIIIFAILLGSIIGGYFFIKNFNLNQYKTIIEEQAYKHTGRKLQISGNAHLGISLIPTLIIDDISLSNTSWAETPQMLTLKSIQIKLAVLPLLQKEIVIKNISLIQPHIYLEKSSTGMVNWNFSSTEKISANQQTLAFAQLEQSSIPQTKSNTILPDYISNISVNNINIENGYVQYFDAQNKKTEKLDISSLSINMDSLDSPINADINVNYNNQPITAKLELGSFNTFFAKASAFPIKINAQAYGINTQGHGTISNLTYIPDFDFNINIYNPAGNLNIPETTLETNLSGNLNKISATIKTLNIVNNMITGTISADISKNIPNITADLQSSKIDLRSLQSTQPLALDFNIISTANAAEYVPATPIPYDILKTVNGNITLNIKELIINDAVSANNILLKSSLNNGILSLKPLTLNFGNGNIELDTTLNSQNKTLSITLNSKDILLQDLHKEFIVNQTGDFGIAEGGKTTIHADLTSKGNTYRQLVQNLNGDFIFVVSNSNVQTGSLHFLTDTFIEQLLNTLKIDKNKSTNINMQCAVIRSNLGQGKADFPQSIAIQSDKLTLSSTGTLNLINDKIDFSLAPAFNFDSGIAQTLSSLIKIEGTVQQPKIKLDDKQALKTIVGIATTGASAYIGSQLLSDGSPCFTALKGTPYQNLVPTPSVASQTTQSVVNATSTAINDTKNAVKQELKNLEKNAKDFFNMLKGK